MNGIDRNGRPARRSQRPVAGWSRRAFLGAGAATAAAASLPLSVQRAIAETPRRAHGRLEDIEHVVILMQENRSFDHYFGEMKGVRGFDDPHAMTLPDGHSVFSQPDPAGGRLGPFRYDTTKTNAQSTPGLPHDWSDQHAAWNEGAMNGWIAAKGRNTMGHYAREDIPFHWALAENFTICDDYHCALIGPTNPNRLYMWTGWIDPDGKYGAPATENDMSADNPRCTWPTYPELLQKAGVSWRIYQEEDNYGDNSLEWFRQFAEAKPSSPLYQRAIPKKSAGWFEYDAEHDLLPQVSWLVAPSAQTEHPNWMPAAGAQYISSKIEAIAKNRDVWAKTAFILVYDENDGQFDHVPPPKAPAGTPGEFVDGVAIGPGFRVPAIIVSPWTVGGYVCSDTFDHTSLIRLLERRFGVVEPNISAWRRSVVGDLTSAFRFDKPPRPAPHDRRMSYAAATKSLRLAQQEVQDNPAPVAPPSTPDAAQAPAPRPARVPSLSKLPPSAQVH